MELIAEDWFPIVIIAAGCAVAYLVTAALERARFRRGEYGLEEFVVREGDRMPRAVLRTMRPGVRWGARAGAQLRGDFRSPALVYFIVPSFVLVAGGLAWGREAAVAHGLVLAAIYAVVFVLADRSWTKVARAPRAVARMSTLEGPSWFGYGTATATLPGGAIVKVAVPWRALAGLRRDGPVELLLSVPDGRASNAVFMGVRGAPESAFGPQPADAIR